MGDGGDAEATVALTTVHRRYLSALLHALPPKGEWLRLSLVRQPGSLEGLSRVGFRLGISCLPARPAARPQFTACCGPLHARRSGWLRLCTCASAGAWQSAVSRWPLFLHIPGYPPWTGPCCPPAGSEVQLPAGVVAQALLLAHHPLVAGARPRAASWGPVRRRLEAPLQAALAGEAVGEICVPACDGGRIKN